MNPSKLADRIARARASCEGCGLAWSTKDSAACPMCGDTRVRYIVELDPDREKPFYPPEEPPPY